jgi:UDPglucose 6-dehydrogenase
MKVSVFGVGYVGLVTGACLAELGNQVVCIDIDPERIGRLAQGQIPFHEPGLPEMVRNNVDADRLRFTCEADEGVRHGEIIFIAVGTPGAADGSADLTQVRAVARTIGSRMDAFKVVVNKSTVPVGTADEVEQLIAHELAQRGHDVTGGADFAVVSNPEFLKEGVAVGDFMRPDRIIVGSSETPAGARARVLLNRLYAPFNRHHDRTLHMDRRSAELTKYAANAMLATRISFMNEIANMADSVGADVDAVRRGIGSDSRIGPSFLYAGTGYGGSCFPKDTQALLETARAHGLSMHLVEAAQRVNQAQKGMLLRHVLARMGEDLQGLTFGVWGLAFKPDTDDMREAPSRDVICGLLRRGARVLAHDPVAMPNARACLVEDLAGDAALMANFSLCYAPQDAVAGVDALLIFTEWKAYRSPDFEAMRGVMRQPLLLDGRNLYEPAQMRELGFQYVGIGRRSAA